MKHCITEPELRSHAYHTYEQIEAAGDPTQPANFPVTAVARGVREKFAYVFDPQLGNTKVCSEIIHRDPGCNSDPANDNDEIVAYKPHRELRKALFGTVWACKVLRKYRGTQVSAAAYDANTIWEYTPEIVAMKMTDKRKYQRFRRLKPEMTEDPFEEVHALNFLGERHTHVIWSKEVLEDDNYLYSIMPFCKGGELFDYVENHGARTGKGLSEQHARYWFRQILSILHHFQLEGICHRDISMENILLNKENNCVLIDMGMCTRVPFHVNNNETINYETQEEQRAEQRRLMTMPHGQKRFGKDRYRTPEVHAEEPFDGFGIDLWAAGVILYTMLMGFPPYEEPDPKTCQRFKLIAMDGELFETLKKWDVHISKEAGDLLQCMLYRDPKKRLTLAQVARHPWVVNGPAEKPPPCIRNRRQMAIIENE